MEQGRYCTECGYQLDPEMVFCPSCGKMVQGSQAEQEMLARQAEVRKRMGHTARIRLLMCVLVYAVPAILSGIALFINSASIADEVWADADFRQMMDDYGLVSSRDEIHDVISYASIMVLISGICARTAPCSSIWEDSDCRDCLLR